MGGEKTTPFKRLPVGARFAYPNRRGEVLVKTDEFRGIACADARYELDGFGIVVWPDERVVRVDGEDGDQQTPIICPT